MLKDNPCVTAEFVRSILSYNNNTGQFLWRSHRKHAGKEAGYTTHLGYRRILIHQKQVLAHRLAWLYVYGEWPSHILDHIDGNPSNNAISNLRLASSAINAHNRRRGTNPTGLLGVQTRLRKNEVVYRATIRVAGKAIQLGTYDTADKAYAAYVAAKMTYHEGSTLPAPSEVPERKFKLSQTGVKNIYANRAGFQVKFKKNKQNICLGTYKTQAEAENVLHNYLTRRV